MTDRRIMIKKALNFVKVSINRWKGKKMKTVSVGIFALILATTSSAAGNCSKHNKANLEAMACTAGYAWDENTAACVKDASA